MSLNCLKINSSKLSNFDWRKVKLHHHHRRIKSSNKVAVASQPLRLAVNPFADGVARRLRRGRNLSPRAGAQKAPARIQQLVTCAASRRQCNYASPAKQRAPFVHLAYSSPFSSATRFKLKTYALQEVVLEYTECCNKTPKKILIKNKAFYLKLHKNNENQLKVNIKNYTGCFHKT